MAQLLVEQRVVPAGLTAVLLHALVRERPLRRGNQQVALAAMLQFLDRPTVRAGTRCCVTAEEEPGTTG